MEYRGTPTIVSERLLLRRFLYTDCQDMLANWISNPNIQSEYGEPVYTTEDEVMQLLKQWIGQSGDNYFYRWAIIEKRSGINIGQIAFCKVYPDVATAEIEYCISENRWGLGYAGEALSAVIDYTFHNTGFDKLEAYHRQENTKSGRVLEKSAMQITESVRRFELQNHIPHGETCYAITKNDYCGQRHQNNVCEQLR